MASPTPHWLALRRQLESVSIDPLTGAEIGSATLAVGTWVENPVAAIERAAIARQACVIVRVQHDDWFGLERVDVAALREALGIRIEPPRHGPGPGLSAFRIELHV